LGIVLTLAYLIASRSMRQRTLLEWASPQGFPENLPSVTLFIAIGSAPSNFALRGAARNGWLRWVPDDGSVRYKFFSDATPHSIAESDTIDWAALETEGNREGDMVLQQLASGYGSNENNVYGQRARYQLKWARESFTEMKFFLRVDDDSFLCLHRLLYELKSAPLEQFFWGRFWCREGRNRADENFMLFSGDIAALLGDDSYVGKIIPFDDRITMGWNFGYWSWIMNLTIFDDQTRIDAQQGYLTTAMHAESIEGLTASLQPDFCDSYIYAHHVFAPTALAAYQQTTIRMMYSVPTRTTNRQTCASKHLSFVPGLHSKLLPDIRIGLSDL
jgi:hypothetical protein